ncbi:hypothetical protein Tco_0089978 [Tanacetum coccineum]
MKRKKSIAFLQSEKEKILSEKKDLADSYLDEIVCLKTANKVARDMLQRFNMPTQTIPMLSKKPKKATNDLHKDILGTRNPGLGYMAKRAQPVLYDADTLLHPNHHPISIWDSEEVLVHQVVSMKKMNEKPGHVRPANDSRAKLKALCFLFLRRNYLRESGSTEGGIYSTHHHLLKTTDRIQLKDTITSLRIQLDGLKVENVSLKRKYDELSKANTHSRIAYTEKLSSLTSENTKLKALVHGKTSSGPSTSEKPKVLASGMYTNSSKNIQPPKEPTG